MKRPLQVSHYALRMKYAGLDQTQDKQECFVLEYKRLDCLYSFEQALACKDR